MPDVLFGNMYVLEATSITCCTVDEISVDEISVDEVSISPLRYASIPGILEKGSIFVLSSSSCEPDLLPNSRARRWNDL